MAKHDTKEPALVIIKRGRNGRGFIVCPADSDMPFPCMSAEDIGMAVMEIMDDENQPRISGSTVHDQPKSESKEQEATVPGEGEDEPEPEAAEEENPYAKQSATYNNMDPMDKAIVNGLSWLANKARKASDYDRNRGGGDS